MAVGCLYVQCKYGIAGRYWNYNFRGRNFTYSGQIELIPLLMFLLMVTRIYGPILSIFANLSSLLNLNVVTTRMRTLLTTPAMAGEEKTVENL